MIQDPQAKLPQLHLAVSKKPWQILLRVVSSPFCASRVLSSWNVLSDDTLITEELRQLRGAKHSAGDWLIKRENVSH